MRESSDRNGWRLAAGWSIGILSVFLLFGLHALAEVPGTLNGFYIPVLAIVLAVRLGRMVYFKRLDAAFSRRERRLFQRWVGAMVLVISADALACALLISSPANSTMKTLVEIAIFWGLGGFLFFKWDLMLSREPIFDPYDAMVLHAAISAGEKGVTIGQLCRFSEERYSPDNEEPANDGVFLGKICRPDDPMFYPKNYDSDVRDRAIEMSLWKLQKAAYLRPKGHEFQRFQMTPKGFSDCAALTWEKPVIPAIAALFEHLQKDGALD